MIDINEVLRRAFEAGKMPPRPKMEPQPLVIPPHLYDRLQREGWDMRPFVRNQPIPVPPLDLRRRPDGVWELPE